MVHRFCSNKKCPGIARGRQGCDGGAGEGAEGGGDPGCGGRAEGAGAEGRKPTASAENPLDERKAEGGPGAEAA